MVFFIRTFSRSCINWYIALFTVPNINSWSSKRKLKDLSEIIKLDRLRC